ncbi:MULTISPECIES: hypothetical protein [unclassified Treponema]|uniref:hypothetical protein n=1 Tax=unclassified Treponema TaxID=2638727 RepID=UPI0020A3E036|nr:MULTISPECIES: hypothetical protein [unclassified Treponema]UTC67089.1 hypothetical protein E4O06_14320 [Treponema sp. OMZ 789]UTC69820.1 hypothetical protein E4O01_14460 [Treponema sp. OMZ 790]UTC72534.1 hypothetical protein E4O02_14550 [Treponema sp. OMZ 791]
MKKKNFIKVWFAEKLKNGPTAQYITRTAEAIKLSVDAVRKSHKDIEKSQT